jgi:hypothetical protein
MYRECREMSYRRSLPNGNFAGFQCWGPRGFCPIDTNQRVRMKLADWLRRGGRSCRGDRRGIEGVSVGLPVGRVVGSGTELGSRVSAGVEMSSIGEVAEG